MGNGLADLDRALDDTIKMKRRTHNVPHKRGGPTPPAARSQPRLPKLNTNKIRKERPSKSNSTFRGRNDSSVAINARIGGSINTRLSSSKGGIRKQHSNINTKKGSQAGVVSFYIEKGMLKISFLIIYNYSEVQLVYRKRYRKHLICPL
jgi:hypothetical protein